MTNPTDESPSLTSGGIMVRRTQLKDQLYLPSQCLFEKDGKQVVYIKRGKTFEATPAKVKFRTENRIALENLEEGTEVALVNPEEMVKKQEKAQVSSHMGVAR